MVATTDEAMSFLRKEAANNSTAWRRKCLVLARSAREIPARYPSALSASHATPPEYRVYDRDKVVRGMVMYFDDPRDDNPQGHIVSVAGRDKAGNLLTWTNDASGPGKVSLVKAEFFTTTWGDSFQFAATWLNGFELPLPGKAEPKPKHIGKLRSLKKGINDLEAVVAYHEKKGHTALVKALKRDIAVLKKTYDNYKD